MNESEKRVVTFAKLKSQIESESEKQEVTFGKLVVGEVMATRGCHPGGLEERRGFNNLRILIQI